MSASEASASALDARSCARHSARHELVQTLHWDAAPMSIFASAMPAPVALLIQCASLEEAEVAWHAVQAFRAGQVETTKSDLRVDPDLALAHRIEKALHGAPMNRPKMIVLTMLRNSAPDAWVAYPEVQTAFAAVELDQERAAAALRDLSWQMREFLPPQDTAIFARKIEVMAARTRSGGVYRYRLTKVGRIAVTNFLADPVVACCAS